jgi:AraC-like DNA-binding protein
MESKINLGLLFIVMPLPTINLISVTLLIGAAQGLFMALVLVTLRQGNHQANIYLAIFLISFSVDLIDEFLDSTNYMLYVPHLLGVTQLTDFLYGPLLYFYVKVLTSPKPFRYQQLWHFLPALLCIIYWIPFYRLNAQVKIALFLDDIEFLKNLEGFSIAELAAIYAYSPLVDVASVIFILTYIVLSLKLLITHGKNIKDQFSSIEKINLNWLRHLLIICFSLWCLFALSEFYDLMDLEEHFSDILFLAIVIVIFMMGFMGIRQPTIFVKPSTPSQTEQASVPPSNKYRKSTLTKTQAKQIVQTLKQFMATDKPFLDNELTLASLADQVAVSPHHLSQVINEELGKNFFDFINQARIEEAKRYLTAPDKNTRSILTIAMDVGFNSKSSFYTAFKKYVHTTPSQFKKQYG